jgi:hypothetical protein
MTTVVQRLLALASTIDTCLGSRTTNRVEWPAGDAAYVEFHPFVDGVRYSIKISLFDDAAAAKTCLDELSQNPDWREKALDPDTPEGKQLAELNQAIAREKLKRRGLPS